MTDMLAMIGRIWRKGCPNCESRDGLRLIRKLDPDRPVLTPSLVCGHCNITWEADPIPASEVSMSSPLEFFRDDRDAS